MNQPQTILTRAEAAALHATTYYTGRPCRRGHDDKRYVSTGCCVVCSKMHSTNYQAVMRGRIKQHRCDELTVQCHPDDHAAIYTLADYLNAQRGLSPTTRPTVAPPPPPDTRTDWEQHYDLLRRVHRHSIAYDLASRRQPETHSAGWAGLRPDDAPAATPVAHGGGAMPDYLR